MIYELRQYRCLPGMLPRVLKRLQEDALPIWAEIGFRPIGFWTTVIGEDDQTIHYMLAWESLAEREAKWQVFGGDARWAAAKARTEADGPMVARISNSILREALPLPA